MKAKKQVVDLMDRELPDVAKATLRIEEGGKHLKVRFTLNGVQCMITAPKSPSDHRWLLNFRADFRRTLRACSTD